MIGRCPRRSTGYCAQGPASLDPLLASAKLTGAKNFDLSSLDHSHFDFEMAITGHGSALKICPVYNVVERRHKIERESHRRSLIHL